MQASDLLQLLQQGQPLQQQQQPRAPAIVEATLPQSNSHSFDDLWKDYQAKATNGSNRREQQPVQNGGGDAARTKNLLNIFESNKPTSPPVVGNPMQAQALLDSLFGNAPASVEPLATSTPIPDQLPQATETVNTTTSPTKKSPFEFTSAFDFLAAATNPAQRVQSTGAPAVSKAETQAAPSTPKAEATMKEFDSPKANSKKPNSKAKEAEPVSRKASSKQKQISENPPQTKTKAKLEKSTPDLSSQSQDESSKPAFTILQRPKEADIIAYGTHDGLAPPPVTAQDAQEEVVVESKAQPAKVKTEEAAPIELSWTVASRLRDTQQGEDRISPVTISPGDGDQPQTLIVDNSHQYLYNKQLETTPITLFSSQDEFQHGKRLALCGSLLCYATKNGRIRVLDRETGARCLLKGHAIGISDLQMHKSAKEGYIQVVSADFDGKICVWRLRETFREEKESRQTLQGQVHVEGGQYITAVRRPPGDLDILLFLTNAGALMLCDLAKTPSTSSDKLELSIKYKFEADRIPIDIAFNDSIPDNRAFTILSRDVDTQSRMKGVDVFTLKQAQDGEFEVQLESGVSLFKNVNEIGYLEMNEQSQLVVSSNTGQTVEVFTIDPSLPGGRFALKPAPTIQLTGPPSYGHIHCHSGTGTLFLTNSERGSIFVVQLESNQEPNIFKSIVEIPTPQRLVDISVEIGEDSASIFCVSPEGITQLHLSRELIGPAQSQNADQGQLEEHAFPSLAKYIERRPSLDNAIKVVVESSTTSLKLDTPAALPRLPPVSDLPPIGGIPFGWSGRAATPLPKHLQPVIAVEDPPRPVDVLPSLKPTNDDLFERLVVHLTLAEETRQQAAQFAELSRQEELLRMVSSTLGQQTSQSLDQTIRSEIRDSVLPAIHQTVRESIDAEVARSLTGTLQKSIPETLTTFFNRPDITNHLVRSFSSSAAPILDRAIHEAMHSVVVPAFTRATQDLSTSLARELRQEILSVRKDLESEQNAALAELSENVRILSETVARLSSLSSLTAARPSTENPSPNSMESGAPLADYEDLLLSALSSQSSPEVLQSLLTSTPPAKIHAIFNGNSQRPFLTQAVILSLAHRLGQNFSHQEGPLNQMERIQLQWFTQCIAALDVHDAGTAPYIPRIIQLSGSSLYNLSARLVRAGDKPGFDLVNGIERLLRSKTM